MSNFYPLSESTLRSTVPSIFSTGISNRLSDKYTHISTWEVLTALSNVGFMPVKAMQCRVRDKSRIEHTKHMIRLRHNDAIADKSGLFPEIVLVNSHDGLSSYRLMAGLYRRVCSNGIIAGNTYNQIRVRHQGDIIGNVIEGTYEVIDSAQKMLSSAHEMEAIILSSDEKRIFAESVHQLKFDDLSVDESGIKPMQFLQARRSDDTKDDLFSIFNVAQENLIKGGLSGYAVSDNGRYRLKSTGQTVKKVTTRAVNSIDENNKLNRAIWSLAEKMQQLKQ